MKETDVKEVVCAGELLEHLQGHHEQRPVQLLVLWSETLDPSCFDLGLVFNRSSHIFHLVIVPLQLTFALTKTVKLYLTMNELVVVDLV